MSEPSAEILKNIEAYNLLKEGKEIKEVSLLTGIDEFTLSVWLAEIMVMNDAPFEEIIKKTNLYKHEVMKIWMDDLKEKLGVNEPND